MSRTTTPLACTALIAGVLGATGPSAEATDSTATATPPAPASVTVASPGYRLDQTATGLAWSPVCSRCDRYIYDGGTLRWITTSWDIGRGIDGAHVVPHLEAGETHVLTVRNRDANGVLSAPSNPVSVHVPDSADETAPSAVRNLHLTDDGGMGGAYLAFDAATDNVDPAANLEYEVTVSSPRFSYMLWLDASTKDFGWIPFDGQSYTLTVRAFDQAANPSAPVSIHVDT